MAYSFNGQPISSDTYNQINQLIQLGQAGAIDYNSALPAISNLLNAETKPVQTQVPQQQDFLSNLIAPFSKIGRTFQDALLYQLPQALGGKPLARPSLTQAETTDIQQRPIQNFLSQAATVGSLAVPVGKLGALGAGAVAGGLGGLSEGLANPESDIGNILGSTLKGAGVGGAVGGILGFAGKKLSPLLEKTGQKIQKTQLGLSRFLDPNDVANLTSLDSMENFLTKEIKATSIPAKLAETEKFYAAQADKLSEVTKIAAKDGRIANVQNIFRTARELYNATTTPVARNTYENGLKQLMNSQGSPTKISKLIGSWTNDLRKYFGGKAVAGGPETGIENALRILLKSADTELKTVIPESIPILGKMGIARESAYTLSKVVKAGQKMGISPVIASGLTVNAQRPLSFLGGGAGKTIEKAGRLTSGLGKGFEGKGRSLLGAGLLSGIGRAAAQPQSVQQSQGLSSLIGQIQIPQEQQQTAGNEGQRGQIFLGLLNQGYSPSEAKTITDMLSPAAAAGASSGASPKDVNNAKDALRSLDQVLSILNNNPNALTEMLNPIYALRSADAQKLSTALQNAVDVKTRLRTGTALNVQEQEFYQQFTPQWYDKPEQIVSKIQNLIDLYSSYLQ